MVTYFELQNKAKELPSALLHRVNCTNRFGCFFTLPTIFPDESRAHAQLIQLCAKELDEYSLSQDIKCKVLIGIYLVVWSYHTDPITEWWGNNLVSLLQKHLKVDSPLQMERVLINDSVTALSEFCTWVYENRESDKAKMNLYNAFPIEIQAKIFHIKTEEWPSPTLKGDFVETVKTYWSV